MAGKPGRSGRKPGSLGEARKRLVEIHKELEAQGKTAPEEVILKMFELGKAGDVNAGKEYLNRRFGTSPESLEITDSSETLFASPEEREAKMRFMLAVLKKEFEK